MKVESKNSQIFQPELYNPVFSESWPKYSLYGLAEWINGMVFRDIEFSPLGEPVIKIAEIKNGITSQTQFTSHNYEPVYHITRGDMLFCWSGQPETSIDIFWWNGPDGWLNQHIFKVLPNEICVTQFLYYLLKYLKPHFIRIACNKQTTGLGHVTKEDIQNIIVRMPDKPLQSAIVSVLQPFDDKIELLRRQNKTLESIAQTIFKEWFVNFTVNGEKLKVNSKTSLPEGWRMGKYGELADVITGKGLKNEFIKEKGKYSVLGANGELGKTDNYLFDENLILTGRVGTLGTVYISRGKVWLSDNVLISKPLRAENFYFIYFNLKRLNFESLNRGSTQPLITQTDLKNIEVIIPKQEVLGAWHNVVSALFDKIYNNNSQIETLSKFRDALLPKLMKGEVRVKGFNN